MTYYYSGHNVSDKLKRDVWEKGQPIDGYDRNLWRRDTCGHAMRFSDHGNENSQYGWEIDHIVPVSKGGSDSLPNLQPLYWENNRKKGNKYPWYCENAA